MFVPVTFVTQNVNEPAFFVFAELIVTVPAVPVVPLAAPVTAPDQLPETVALATFAPFWSTMRTVARPERDLPCVTTATVTDATDAVIPPPPPDGARYAATFG